MAGWTPPKSVQASHFFLHLTPTIGFTGKLKCPPISPFRHFFEREPKYDFHIWPQLSEMGWLKGKTRGETSLKNYAAIRRWLTSFMGNSFPAKNILNERS